ncbi:hypothetical protein NSA52_04300 [Clostridium sporogenes]|nr:hypothetical protein [Clostridium sporogenes]MCR1973356.1 hypothetical protein [Clostridium sporogenes]
MKPRTLFINELEEVLENETLHNKELFKDYDFKKQGVYDIETQKVFK